MLRYQCGSAGVCSAKAARRASNLASRCRGMHERQRLDLDLRPPGRRPAGQRHAVVGAPLRLTGLPLPAHEPDHLRVDLEVLVVIRQQPPHHRIVGERTAWPSARGGRCRRVGRAGSRSRRSTVPAGSDQEASRHCARNARESEANFSRTGVCMCQISQKRGHCGRRRERLRDRRHVHERTIAQDRPPRPLATRRGPTGAAWTPVGLTV